MQSLALNTEKHYYVQKIDEQNERHEIAADVVEFTFKQQYIGRIQMWNMKNTLIGKLIFVGQEILHNQGPVLVRISEIRTTTHILRCALVTPQTRLVFLSESGKIFLMIQISSEMYEPLLNCSFLPIELLVYRLLPELFEQWQSKKTNHILSVVLFARVVRDGAPATDFFQTLVDWEIAVDWTDRLVEIRRAIMRFRDSIFASSRASDPSAAVRLSRAYDGNWLEANNLAINIFDKHYIDRDLDRTGLSIINVTAGQAVYSVGFDLTQLSKQKVCDNGIFMHVICLNVPPLYLVPMLVYYYQNEGRRFSDLSLDSRASSVIPHWFNCSFFIGEVENENIFSYGRLPRPNFTRLIVERLFAQIEPNYRISGEYRDADQWIAELDAPPSPLLQVTKHAASGSKSQKAEAISQPKKSLLSQKIASAANLSQNDSPTDTTFKPLASIEQLTARYSILQLNRSSYNGPASLALSTSGNASHSLPSSKFAGGSRNLFQNSHVHRCSLFRNKLGSYCRRWNDVNAHLADDERKNISTDWKVLIRPPCLPIETDFFPSEDDLRRDYKEYTYALHLGQNSPFCKNEHVLETLVSQRLAQGFQIIPFKTVIKKEYYLSLGTEIHILENTSYDTITVRRFLLDNNVVCAFHSAITLEYAFNILCVGASSFVQKTSKFVSLSLLQAFNWNYFDYLVAGHNQGLVDSLKFWRTRLLLIPIEAPPKNISTIIAAAHDEVLSPEESRIMGFLKFIEHIQDLSLLNNGVKFEHDKQLKNSNRIKVRVIPKSVHHLYGENSAFISDNTPFPLVPPVRQNSANQTDESLRELFDDPTFGLSFCDIKWHCRAHKSLLLGSDLVDWFMVTFEDISTRTEAVAFGNQLIERGVIEHYYKKHRLIDGFFFYRMTNRFSDVKGITQAKSPLSAASLSASKPASPSLAAAEQPIQLSKMLFVNVDTKSQSKACEWAALHFDTFYNVKSCYHIHLHWLTCTPRILDEFIQSMSRKAYHCGFYLVESNVNQYNPRNEINVFSAPISVTLACSPPAFPTNDEANSLPNDRTLLFSELMRKFGFILDTVADEEVLCAKKIEYSFEKPPYAFDQFTHVSGMYHCLVSKISHASLFLIKNRLRSTKQSVVKDNRDSFDASLFLQFCANASKLQMFWETTRRSIASRSNSFSFENCLLKPKPSARN